MIGIYHKKDLDGWSSGAIMKRRHPGIELIGWDYGMPIPDLPGGRDVIMADVSFPMDVMEEIARKSKSMVWIDHHHSAIQDYLGHFDGRAAPFKAVLPPLDDNGEIKRKMGACELAWYHLFPNEDLPYAVKLLGWYDVHRDKDHAEWEAAVMPFQLAMMSKCNSPDTFDQTLLANNIRTGDAVRKLITTGKDILEYQETVHALVCDQRAYEIQYRGNRAICINSPEFSSRAFDSVYDPGRHDIMICYAYNKMGKWNVSLYSDKPEIDVSIYAKDMGGGGHKGAAGFETDDISIILK